MITVKEYNKETQLKEKLKELKYQLIQTQQELQQSKAHNKQLEALLLKNTSEQKSTTITIRSATKVEFVKVEDIICCNADFGYTDIQLSSGKTITATKSLNKFEELFQEHNFFRISKSHLINPTHIVTFHKDRNKILLKGNVLLAIARRRRVEFLKTLE